MRCGWGWAEDRRCRPEPGRSTAAPGLRHDGGRCGPNSSSSDPATRDQFGRCGVLVHGWWISGSGTRLGPTRFDPISSATAGPRGDQSGSAAPIRTQADRMSSAIIPVNDTVLLFAGRCSPHQSPSVRSTAGPDDHRESGTAPVRASAFQLNDSPLPMAFTTRSAAMVSPRLPGRWHSDWPRPVHLHAVVSRSRQFGAEDIWIAQLHPRRRQPSQIHRVSQSLILWANHTNVRHVQVTVCSEPDVPISA